MAAEHLSNQAYPQTAAERIIYESLARIWSNVLLQDIPEDPFALSTTLEVAYRIPPFRMMDLNWSAYRDICEIEAINEYKPRHAAFSTLDY